MFFLPFELFGKVCFRCGLWKDLLDMMIAIFFGVVSAGVEKSRKAEARGQGPEASSDDEDEFVRADCDGFKVHRLCIHAWLLKCQTGILTKISEYIIAFK